MTMEGDVQAIAAGRRALVEQLRQPGSGALWGPPITATAADALEVADERIAVLEEALRVGGRFLNACMSAWSCGEPAHRVKTMLDRADEFRALLTGVSDHAG